MPGGQRIGRGRGRRRPSRRFVRGSRRARTASSPRRAPVAAAEVRVRGQAQLRRIAGLAARASRPSSPSTHPRGYRRRSNRSGSRSPRRRRPRSARKPSRRSASQLQSSGGSGAGAAPEGGTSAGSGVGLGALSSAEPESPGSDGGTGSVDGAGSVPGRDGGVEPPPAAPPDPLLPPEPLPEQVQLSRSTHEKPSPQFAAVAHGSDQRGTHWLVVTVLHSAGSGAGRSQFPSGGHAGVASPEHSWCVSFRQTMLLSQSASLEHGSGTQASTVASHGGHSLPGAQAMAGHAAFTSSRVALGTARVAAGLRRRRAADRREPE